MKAWFIAYLVWLFGSIGLCGLLEYIKKSHSNRCSGKERRTEKYFN